MWKTIIPWGFAAAVGCAVAGCRGLVSPEEREARGDFAAVAHKYRDDRAPKRPLLTNQSSFQEFLQFALLNHPQIEAAYYDWAASIEHITVERSLPDPKLTFESDIADIVITLMPGLMQEFPGPGKLKARATAAGAESQAKYFAFERAALETTFQLKVSSYQLHFLDERLRINRNMQALLGDLEQLAQAQNEVGKATLQDVLRAQIERDRVQTEIANLEDSRRPKVAAFKAALGLTFDQPDPPAPARLDTAETNADWESLLRTAFDRNPSLRAMESDIRTAEAGIAIAYKERVPDFSLGLMADAEAAPIIVRPLASVSLPLWRDKLAAEMAQAQATLMAARTRRSAGQLALTVEFAEKSFAARELGRNLDLLQTLLIPKAHLSLEIARAGYLGGTIDFFNLIDAERALLNFELAEVDARTQREVVLAQLSLLIAGVPPAEAAFLETKTGRPEPTH